MKTGDKVRFLRSTESGIIRRIIDNSTVEVEIEDDFLIPMLKSELVVVSKQETKEFEKSDDIVSDLKNEKTEGLYLAFTPFNDKILSLNIINASSMEILTTVSFQHEAHCECIFAGTLSRNTFLKTSELALSDFDKWPSIIIQGLYYRNGKTFIKEPLNKNLKFKATSFFKAKKQIPLMNKEGYLFQLDNEILDFNPAEVIEKMYEQKGKLPGHATSSLDRPQKEIDLHIEKLVKDYKGLDNSEILKIQVRTFEHNLESAIATGMEEIIFIHGVGNGVLKNQIHKLLSSNKNIKFFKDAQKEKFGYGATLVRLK
jgi:hypothetical protein